MVSIAKMCSRWYHARMGKKVLLLVFMAVLPATAFATTQENRPGISIERLLAAMDEVERTYYFQSFDYAMEEMKKDEKFEWKSYDSSGYFQVGMPFVRNDTVCRSFREYIVNNKMYAMSSEGVGCKRLGRDGWCKLKKDDMRTCAMEAPQGAAENAREVLDEAGRRLERTNVEGKSWWNQLWPF